MNVFWNVNNGRSVMYKVALTSTFVNVFVRMSLRKTDLLPRVLAASVYFDEFARLSSKKETRAT